MSLRSINLDYWRPQFICMEVLTADGARNQEAVDYLAAHSYLPIVDMGLNIIFQRGRDG